MSAGPGAYAHPLFDPLRSWLDRLPGRPDLQALAALAAARPIRTASGRPVRFVPPQTDGLGYERRVWERGEVETRPGNWHDFFNALVWLAFPRAKAALNARHVGAIAAAGRESGAGQVRGHARDAMTHLDECGLAVLADDPSLLDLLRGFQWKSLFWQRRADVVAHMRFIVFGHATYEALLAPFFGLTAKAILYPVDRATLALPVDELRAALDGWLARDLAAGTYDAPRALQPVPLLGIPGATSANADPAYYDDVRQFRPGRRESGRVGTVVGV